jgi:hypothetical protein
MVIGAEFVFVHYDEIGAGYLFDSSFQEAYLERGVDFYVVFWMKYLLFPRSRRMPAHYMAH